MEEAVSPEKARYDFKKGMQEIVDVRGHGTELISLYVPPTRQISDVMAYLRDEYSQSSNIKSKGTMKNVQSAIDSIMARLRTFKTVPEKGIAIFCGEVPRAGDQTRMVQHVLYPPEPIVTFMYRCDSQFYTEPLKGMLLDKKSFGLIVIDRQEATIGILSGSTITPLKNIDSLVPRKHRQGGQSAQRFERLIELAAHEFFKKVADSATDAFLHREDMQGIILGGPGYTKEYFLKEDYLHHELLKKVVGTFDTGYTDEYGLKELVENAKDALRDLDLTKEKELIQRLFSEIRKQDGGLSAYGEDSVRYALEMGAVDTILLSEGLNKRRLKVKCQNGHEYSVTVPEGEDEDKVACSVCNDTAEVVYNEDIVDDFFERADSFSTNVELISEDSEEGQMLIKAFGGIAALLRFRVE